MVARIALLVARDEAGHCDLVVKGNLAGADRISVRGGRASWPYSLDEASQGRIGVRSKLGNTVEWCAEAGAKLTGSPPSTSANDRQDRFVAQARNPAPLVCPPPGE